MNTSLHLLLCANFYIHPLVKHSPFHRPGHFKVEYFWSRYLTVMFIQTELILVYIPIKTTLGLIILLTCIFLFYGYWIKEVIGYKLFFFYGYWKKEVIRYKPST